jgi:hypothetical protein
LKIIIKVKKKGGVMLNNNDLRFVDIIDLHIYFSKTSYGKELSKSLRFELYRPREFSKELWTEALGLDGNVLDHALKNYLIGETFLRKCNNPSPFWPIDKCDEAVFSTYEQKLILLACIIHDWGEPVNGDISFILKTMEDDLLEMGYNRLVSSEIFAEYKNKTLLEFVKIALENVVISKQNKLGKAFSIIEKIGYLQSGINSWRYGLGAEERFKWNFFTISVSVFMHFIPPLLEAAKVYPGAYSHLIENKGEINEIKIIESKYINFHQKDDPSCLVEAVKKWDEFCNI